MTRYGIKVNVRPVAQRQSTHRIVEFSDDNGVGGLIEFRSQPADPHNPVAVHVYRTDPSVIVTHTNDRADGRPAPADLTGPDVTGPANYYVLSPAETQDLFEELGDTDGNSELHIVIDGGGVKYRTDSDMWTTAKGTAHPIS